MLTIRSLSVFFCSGSSAFDICSYGGQREAPSPFQSSGAICRFQNSVWKGSRRIGLDRDKSFRLWASRKFRSIADMLPLVREEFRECDSNVQDEFRECNSNMKDGAVEIEGYSIEGISVGGHETCIIVPALKMAFDIGRCPPRAVAQDFLFITHGHMDHIGGLPMYVATRSLYNMKAPTIFVPVSIKESVEKLFEVHRAMDHSELKHNLVALEVGEEYEVRKDLVVRPFKTYHVVPSQGYIIYSVKQKLKKEYLRLRGNEIKKLKFSGVKITDTVMSPEIAVTGDTMSDFIVDPNNADVLKAKILIMETTFVDNVMSIEHAREYGHTHLFEVVALANWFRNKAILLTHFSNRYRVKEIRAALSNLPSALASKVFPLTEGFRSDHL